MLLAVLELLTFIFLLVGMIVSLRGMKSENIIYKGGFFFFLFSLLSKLYTIIVRLSMDAILKFLQDKSEQSIGYWVANLGISASLLTAAGLIIFVVCLLRGLSTPEYKKVDEV